MALKGYFLLKTEKNRISLGTKVQLKLEILNFLDQINPKRVFPVKNEKSEHHNSILYIRISLGNFDLLDQI